MKTNIIRIFPTDEQIIQLNELSLVRNTIWNYFIKMEQDEYETNGKIIHNYEMDKRLTELRKDPFYSSLNSKSSQRITKEIYSSYQSFFRLIKKDKTARPPKLIENINQFHTIVFNQSGWSIHSENEITINKIKLRYKSNIDISKIIIKELRIKFVNGKWLCDICYHDEIDYRDTITQENKILAIDLGLKILCTGVDNEGKVVVIHNRAKKISKYYLKQIAKVQNKLSKKTKDSKKYKKLKNTINKLYKKKNSQVKHALHTQSNKLLGMNYKTIVIGDLSVKKLMELEENKYKKISKSFHMSNINMFLTFLMYKSYKFNTDIVKINEQHTTQLNSLTGKLFDKKVEISDRVVKLDEGIEIDRDLNSAINILERYFNNHLAVMTRPLDKIRVIHEFNLMNKPSQIGKPTNL